MCETAVTSTPPSNLLKRREGVKHADEKGEKHNGEKGRNTQGRRLTEQETVEKGGSNTQMKRRRNTQGRRG